MTNNLTLVHLLNSNKTKGYEDSTNRVFQLLHGMKQATRCWNKKFSKILKTFNFEASKADSCVFQVN